APRAADVYTFAAPVSGGLTVHEDAAGGSGLETSLTLFDSTGRQVAAFDDTLGTGHAWTALEVASGQSYYVVAAGHGNSTGAYTLTVAPYADDIGGTPA